MVLVDVLIHSRKPEDFVGFIVYSNRAYSVDYGLPLISHGSARQVGDWIPIKRGQEIKGITCAS